MMRPLKIAHFGLMLLVSPSFAACSHFDEDASREVSLEASRYCMNASLAEKSTNISRQELDYIESIHRKIEKEDVRRDLDFSVIYKSSFNRKRYAYFYLVNVSDIAVAYEIGENNYPLYGFYVTTWRGVTGSDDLWQRC